MSCSKQCLDYAKKAVFGLALSSLVSMGFAWSISGNVTNEDGVPLASVAIASMNYSGISGTTDDAGNFSVSNEDPNIVFGKNSITGFKVEYKNNLLSINNVAGKSVKVSLMDALGKIAYQNEFSSTNILLDLKKNTNQKFMILKVRAEGSNHNYVLTQKGATLALLKEGGALANIAFSLAGYRMETYQMVSEVETDVKIVMHKQVIPSSSSQNPDVGSSSNGISSSSVYAPTSSSTPEITSCTGKTLIKNQDIYVDNRKVIVKFPAGYDGTKPAPLLVNYHPIGGSATAWAGSSQIAQNALADGAIVIFPDGEQSPNRGQAWNVGPCCTDADDITFTKNFIKKLKDESCIDPKRIYAAGYSMGGGMSNYVACKMADIFAAVAPSAMDLSKEVVDDGMNGGCNPSRPIPVLNFRGTADFVVVYDGAYSDYVAGKAINFLGAKKNLAAWVRINGCTGSAKSSTPYNGCELYDTCNGGVQTGLCTIQGGGHNEGPGDQAWNFLKQWKLP